MKIKDCPKCKKAQTTKNATFDGRDEIALYFTCKCGGSFILRAKNWKTKITLREVS